MSVRLGIDAGNFARDRRGMGRVARAIAASILDDPDFEVTFLLDQPRDEAGLRDAFTGRALAVEGAPSASQAGAYDAVWFPWNGMRYGVHAPALLTINDAFAFAFPHRNRVARAREQAPIRRGAREASRIVTCSGWSRAEIARFLEVDPDHVDVIAYAPDPMFSPGGDDALMKAWRYLLLVCAREPRKNAGLVIEACAAAFTSPLHRLAIVGDVAPEERRMLVRLGVPHTLFGGVDDRTLRTLYRNARVVAVPSIAEGFGLVAVEAMACGAPTLAAGASAFPETSGGGALLLDPADVTAWSGAIRRALSDDAFAAALATRGLERIARVDRAAPARAYRESLRRLAAR